jgi:hypothetical protein
MPWELGEHVREPPVGCILPELLALDTSITPSLDFLYKASP